MKQISKKLSLKKKTVAVLNQQELNEVKGGATKTTCTQVYDSINYCPPPETQGFYTRC